MYFETGGGTPKVIFYILERLSGPVAFYHQGDINRGNRPFRMARLFVCFRLRQPQPWLSDHFSSSMSIANCQRGHGRTTFLYVVPGVADTVPLQSHLPKLLLHASCNFADNKKSHFGFPFNRLA